jgi:membrane-associated phospholipid phosphatase
VRYRLLDAMLVVGGLIVLATSAVLARRGAYGWEAVIFKAINGLPDGLRPFLWVPNQYGTAVTIPLTAAAALLFRRWRLAISLAVSGVAVYWLAKVIKGYVERGRPAALLDGVVERETFHPHSLGYPSGHAAVAWAITIIVVAYLGRPWRIAAITLAIVVPLVRIYVAAHLPLDLVGGAALGVTIASGINFLFGLFPPVPAEGIRAGPAPA